MKSVVFCFVVVGAVAAESERLTLDQAIAEALRANPHLRAAEARIGSAKGAAAQAGLWSNPALEINAEDMPSDGGGFSHSKNTVGLSQTVPFPGKKPLDTRIARHGVRVSELEYHAARAEVVREVKVAFCRALAGEQRATISQHLVELAGSLALAARKRVEAGAAPAQEQLRAEIELDRAKTELSNLRREQAEARQSLQALLDPQNRREAAPAGALAETADAALLQQAREQTVLAHPSRVAAAAAVDRADTAVSRARLTPYPDITFGVAGGRNEGSHENLVEFRVSLPLPLFDRGHGQTREALANRDIAQANLTATEQRLLKELRSAEARLRASAEQVGAYRERILPKAEEALRLVRAGFEEGKFGFIDLLDTQRTAVEARLAYYDKLLELNVAQAELESLLMKDLQGQKP
jgi:cobalt-zinc-cadmium efflux system outer membrane protein